MNELIAIFDKVSLIALCWLIGYYIVEMTHKIINKVKSKRK